MAEPVIAAQPSSNIHILLLNPNSSTSMTYGMETAAKRITSITPSVTFDAYTAPSPSPASINNDLDIQASSEAVLRDALLHQNLHSGIYDAVLVACFSVHTLVATLSESLTIPVTGIFEASILTSLSLLPPPSTTQQWGIVTTGEFWETHLSNGVADFLGQAPSSTSGNRNFTGVFSTGLTAGDFHTVSPEDVRARLEQATRQLLNAGEVTCVVMGCGGMAGLQDIIRSVALEVYGRERAKGVYIVDGVQAGILQLQQTVLSRRVFG
ncbi:putative C1F7.10-like protein [Cladobotryum mycophilum]|uniref:C1F7.10-like protein n=1 Tax=Cladobotryum mycophilum TaxID=491253 RepID=A0ABR0SIX8_9HYPO